MFYGLTWFPFIGPFPNPYYGGFGHFNTAAAGAGYLYPGFTFPFLPGADVIQPGL